MIRTILNRDRSWSVYALGDLSPGFAEHSEWFALPDEPPALVLLYRRFDPPILFTIGRPDRLAELIREIDAPVVSLHMRPEALDALSPCYRLAGIRSMWRMVVNRERFRPLAPNDVLPLTVADLHAISGLYADGHPRGEEPDFFDASMVAQGMFRGLREGGELVAIAGTHLIAPLDGVCAIGNVYTRQDRRGRGLAARVVGAVVAEAFHRNLPTVVLNVNRKNAAAIRVYERLGFTRYCDFVEGLARSTE